MSFANLGVHGKWWSSTGEEDGSVWVAGISYQESVISFDNSNMGSNAFSVRCVKD